MILWVAELSARAVGKDHVFIATDDDRIFCEAEKAGFTPLMTSSFALTGTDRIAEAARQIDYDIYVNVQGDEPLVIQLILRCNQKKNPKLVVNGFCQIGKTEDASSVNIPKVVMNETKLVYMSRVCCLHSRIDNMYPVNISSKYVYTLLTRSSCRDMRGLAANQL